MVNTGRLNGERGFGKSCCTDIAGKSVVNSLGHSMFCLLHNKYEPYEFEGPCCASKFPIFLSTFNGIYIREFVESGYLAISSIRNQQKFVPINVFINMVKEETLTSNYVKIIFIAENGRLENTAMKRKTNPRSETASWSLTYVYYWEEVNWKDRIVHVEVLDALRVPNWATLPHIVDFTVRIARTGMVIGQKRTSNKLGERLEH